MDKHGIPFFKAQLSNLYTVWGLLKVDRARLKLLKDCYSDANRVLKARAKQISTEINAPSPF